MGVEAIHRLEQTIERMAVWRQHAAGHQQTLQRILRGLAGVIAGLSVKTFRSCQAGDGQIALNLPDPGLNTGCDGGSNARASRPIAAQ